LPHPLGYTGGNTVKDIEFLIKILQILNGSFKKVIQNKWRYLLLREITTKCLKIMIKII